MPVIQRFANGRIAINPMDHAPPHFHILLNDGREAWVAIATLEIPAWQDSCTGDWRHAGLGKMQQGHVGRQI
jgi:hypothetical protein